MISQTALIGTLIAGFATGAGALPIFFKKKFSQKSLELGLSYSAGIMLIASFTSLLLPAFEESKRIFSNGVAFPITAVAFMVGYLFITGVHHIIPHGHVLKKEKARKELKLSKMALVVLAICLHNFPEGLAVGVGFGAGNDTEGMSLALAIAIQNLPEGLVVAIGILNEGASKYKAFGWALLSGLVEPLAALLGFFSVGLSTYGLCISLAFAAGAMLFVICQELFPVIFKEGYEGGSTLGVLFGILTMLAIDFYV